VGAVKEWQKELYIYRLSPAPPRKDDLQEYINLYLQTGNEQYFNWFMHYYEPTLNTTAMAIVQQYSMFGHFINIKEACVFGIAKALKSYDVSSGVPFLTYKTRIMWEEIHNYIRTMRSGFTVPSADAYANLRKIMALYNKSGKYDDDTIKSISAEAKLSEKLVREMLAGGLRNLSFVDFYKQYADEDSERSREDVTCDYTFEPCRAVIHIEQHDAVFNAFGSLSYLEREVVRAHLGFCDKCHSTNGEKNRRQTFYEIAIDHEYSSAEAVENIYYKALEKMKQTLRNLI
jgi:DNA-directed RNA polymerase sigma subunit (sigma70/sigma32)